MRTAVVANKLKSMIKLKYNLKVIHKLPQKLAFSKLKSQFLR